jgi:hypothetical protein
MMTYCLVFTNILVTLLPPLEVITLSPQMQIVPPKRLFVSQQAVALILTAAKTSDLTVIA